MNKQKLIILTGPTAVGKSNLSIKLAKTIGGEIISADSMQVYKYMNIGTDKISKEKITRPTRSIKRLSRRISRIKPRGISR